MADNATWRWQLNGWDRGRLYPHNGTARVPWDGESCQSPYNLERQRTDQRSGMSTKSELIKAVRWSKLPRLLTYQHRAVSVSSIHLSESRCSPVCAISPPCVPSSAENFWKLFFINRSFHYLEGHLFHELITCMYVCLFAWMVCTSALLFVCWGLFCFVFNEKICAI